MRSVLRWLRRLVLGALALAALVTAVVLIAAHTDWGRAQVRRRVEAALHDAFPGGARVGRLDGSILGTLTLRGVELDGRDRRPMLTIGTLDAEVALWPLLGGTARIERVAADDVHVFVRDQPPAPVVAPSPASPSPWRVELPRIALHRVAVELAVGAPVTLDELEVAGAGIVGPGGVALFGWAHGQWRERAVGWAAVASVVLDGGVRVPAAMIRVGDAALGATGVVIDGDAPRGAIAVSAPAATLRALVPALARVPSSADPRAPIVATVEARTAAPTTTQLAIQARVGPTRLWAALRGARATWDGQGVVQTDGLALAIGADRLGVAAAEVPFVVTARPRGQIDLAIRDARATAVRYDDLAAAALTASLRARVSPEVVLEQARVTVSGARRGPTLLGAAEVALRGRGAGRYDLAATAWPATPGLIVATEAQVDVRGVPRAQLVTTQITLPSRAVWRGHGGWLIVDDRVRLRDLTLARGAITLAIGGELAPRTGALAVHVGVDGVVAAQLDPRLRGQGRARIELARRGGAWQADARLAVTDFALGPAGSAIDGSAHVTLAGSRVTLDAHAASAALGGLGVALDLVPPRDLFELAAWQALDRRALHRAELRAERFQLAGLAGFVTADPAVVVPALAALTGTLDGTVDLAPGALTGTLAVRDVALPLGTLAADLTLAPLGDGLGAHATARISELPALEVSAQLAIPPRPFATATWQRRGRDLLRAASGTLADVVFDPELLGKLGISDRLAAHGIPWPLHGRVAASFALGDGAREARIALEVREVAGGPLTAPISQQLEITARPSGTHGRWALRSGALALGALEVDLAMPTDRWIDEPAAVRTAPLTGHWTLPVTPVAALLALAGQHDLAAGTLEGSAAIAGTLASPIVDPVRLVARDLAVASPGGPSAPALQTLEVTARWDGTRGRLALDGRQGAGGALHAELTGRPGALAEATGALVSHRLDVGSIAALVPRAMVPTAGVLDADLALRPGGRLTGSLALARGVVPISSSVGTLRDASAAIQIGDDATHATIDGALGAGHVHLDAAGGPGLTTVDVRALELRDVTLSTALRPRITADVTARLRRDRTQVTGTIDVARATVTLPAQGGTPLLDATLPDDLILPGAEAPVATGARPPTRTWLRVDLALHRTKVVANELAEGVGFQGTLRSDVVHLALGDTIGATGSVAIEEADVVVLGRHYVVEPSALELDGTADPRLQLRMSHAFSSMTLLVDVGGRASRPVPVLRGEPAGYTPDQLFGFFLGGEPGGEPGSQTREAVTGAAAQVISSKLGRQVSKVLPIQVDMSCGPTTTTATASCTVGKWLTERLFLAYRQHLERRGDESSRDAEVQIRMGRKVVIEGTVGDGQHVGADLLWRHRW